MMINIPYPDSMRQWTLNVLHKKYESKIKQISDLIRKQAERGKTYVIVKCDSSDVARDIMRIFNEADYTAQRTFMSDTEVRISW